ncbi:Uncharacterised protein [Serratia quinivorans]|jgi:hypothetical protein|nr:Uncharacterised protein [Serratia quinivorans]CAI1793735.1 Uncharacterised protein [Serratia quinivorans]
MNKARYSLISIIWMPGCYFIGIKSSLKILQPATSYVDLITLVLAIIGLRVFISLIVDALGIFNKN